MIKLFGPPNLVVTDQFSHYAPFRFNENGEAVVDENPFTERAKMRYASEAIDVSENTEVVDDYVSETTEAIDDSVPENTETKQYPCKKCGKIFEDKVSLMAHCRKQHPKEGK